MNNRLTKTAAAAFVLVLGSLAGCVQPPYQQQAQYPQAPPSVAGVEYGHVSKIELVTLGGTQKPGAMGLVLGALVGGAVGNQIGSGSGRAVATIAGVAAGAAAGHSIESANNANRAQPVREVLRLSIQMNDGSVRSYDVSSVGDLRVGDPVMVRGNQISRY